MAGYEPGMTNPSQWTSEYNNRFRDRRQYISPNTGQPMYHFSDAYDPSHFDGFNYREAELDTTNATMQSGTWAADLPPPSNYKELAEQQQQQQRGQSSANPLQAAPSSTSFAPGENPFHTTAVNYEGPRNKFHVPGYGGFVKGKQFRHGDTYGKATRKCLDVPSDLPLEN